MSNLPSPDITVIEGDQRWSGNKDILIRGETPFMKTWFFEAVKRCTKFYENKIDFKKDSFEGESAAYDLDARESEPDGTIRVKGLRVGFNLESLQRREKNFNDLKEPILFHEAMEIWYKVKPGRNIFEKFREGDRRADLLSHFLGMIEQYRQLQTVGKTKEFQEWYHQQKLDEVARKLDAKAYEIASEGKMDDDLSKNLDKLYDEFWSVYKIE